MSAPSLDRAQQEQYRELGFTVCPGFLSTADIEQVSQRLAALARPERPTHGEARYYEKCTDGSEALLRVENLLAEPGLRKLLLSAPALAALEALLGEPPLLFKDKANYKPPGARADLLHQDQAAGWNRYGETFVTLGIAVDRNDAENAALWVMDSGRYEHALMAPEWEPLSREEEPPWGAPDDYRRLDLEPGDAFFFDAYVPHGSPPNRGKRGRRNLFLTFNPRSQGDERARYYEDKWRSYPPNEPGGGRGADTFRV